MRVEHAFADGDALMHALIAAGGHDPEFLTDDQLAAAPLRLPVADYLDWYATLPERAARRRSRSAGARRRATATSTATTSWSRGSSSGNVLRRDPAAARLRRGPGRRSTTTPSCRRRTTTSPATAGSTRVWGADAIVHLGKHGTLEWLPGKMLALSAGVRARRRARRRAARLPVRRQRPRRGRAGQAPRARGDRRPPGAADDARRAPTTSSPSSRRCSTSTRAWRCSTRRSCPALAARDLVGDRGAPTCRPTSASTSGPTTSARWSSTSTATSARSRTSRSRTACTCSAARPRASSCAGWSRRCCGSAPATCPGLRARGRRRVRPRRAGARGRRRARRRRARPPSCSSASADRRRAPATSSTASRRRRRRCSTRSRERDWDPAAAGRRLRARCSGRADAGVERVAALRRRRGRPAHPRHDRPSSTHVLAALRGRHVPAGPSGQPDARAASTSCRPGATSTRSTRARCPSELSWEVGRRLADALLERHRARDRRAAADGRPRRLGHVGDAHAGRRRRRDPRAARRAADAGTRSRGG